MSNQNYEDQPYWGTCASDPTLVCEKPSPLRIVKADENMNKWHTANHSNQASSKHRRSIQGDGSLTVAKRRKINPGQADADKENLRWTHDDPRMGIQGSPTLLEANCQVQSDDSPPLRLGVTPSPQLLIRKTRQARPEPGGQLRQGHPFYSPISSELPGVYNLRHPVKARSPLTNIYDRAFMSNAELSLAPPATSREEESPLFRRSPPVVLTDPFKTLPRPRLERWSTPQITITPEATAIEEGCHRFWVAIEVSVRRWPETGEICGDGDLGDLDVQISPAEESSVIHILQEQPFPIRRLDPGSSIFLLAQVQVRVSKAMRRCRQKCSRLESDNLIEALKEELGDSTVSYMTVRLSYRNSAFPMCQYMGNVEDDMFSMHSKIETVATASVKLHNAMSLWSPPPVSRSNPLLPLVERHWGTTRAREVMAQIAGARNGPEDPEQSSLGIIALRLRFLPERQVFNEAAPRSITVIEKRTRNLNRD
ncbi:hypothetical protein F52700_9205 [Fusarium sp. NRRL 52700]|nr:hypothetical protein F52700_9205 [Fusarium sp. NRRL 52700]